MEDPTFFYAIQLDKEDGRIANFFWADGQSIMDYDTNKFEMPFAPLLGTNHHKHPIIFGCALLFNETIESFVWLFETFLTAMSGKHPSTIFADQDAAMAGAIAYVFPNTRHRLCIWHIYLNAAKHLGHRCVYEDRSEDYFKKKWNELLIEYGLQDNSWMLNLYSLREKWAAVYRDSFTADMREKGAKCEKVSTTLRENELEEDFQSRKKKKPVNYVQNLPLLKTAAESYTRRMYKEFEEEFKNQFSYSCKLLKTEGSISTFMVTHMYFDYGATVAFDTTDMTITCSCRKYESIGILCKHAFKVFDRNDVFILPPRYIMNRWTNVREGGKDSAPTAAEGRGIRRGGRRRAIRSGGVGEESEASPRGASALESKASASTAALESAGDLVGAVGESERR
ncbi:hypothetical protein U9M48_002026 [Paspalum notatum var. saurae]|uniref:SWIM-type domain-containing protein n=1 Tax=Paspalum notatum var. saurae TaxID=547442 RepID=A0AAQ3PGJ1_PASNO